MSDRSSVLYVEDNSANLALVERILEMVDAVEMTAARTAEAGLELAREQRPDLIIMDINLPGMSGIEALRILKTMPATRDVPVMAMSASATQQDVQDGMAAGFDCYLTKPIDVQEFLQQVSALLGRPVSV